MAKRYGRQTPTAVYKLDFEQSLYQEAVVLYERSGNQMYEWQKLLLKDIMGQTDEELWTHTKVGYSVPRRNGKTEVVYAREIWGLMHGEQVLHSAHRNSTSHSSFEKTCDLLKKMGVEFEAIKALGAEKITVPDTGGRINYRTRTGSGGLGEGFDLLVIDEAQEYTDAQRTALVYTVTDSANPQTIMCGTPPTSVSRGTIFPKFRKSCLSGAEKNALWAEWSVDKMSDIHAEELWYETNPSMGYHLNTRKIEDEISADEVDFNIQRLGLWLEYSQASAISKAAWDACLEPDAKLTGPLFAAVKYAKKTDNVVLAVAAKTATDKTFVEVLDCRSSRQGTDWILAFLKESGAEKIVVDGQAGQQLLVADLKDAGLPKPVLPTVKEVIDANAQFEMGIFQKQLAHAEQPSVTHIVSNCEHRAIGTNGGYGYASLIDSIDETLIETAALAYWICRTTKPKKKQRKSY